MMMNLFEVSRGDRGPADAGSSCATRAAGGRSTAATEKFQADPHWRDHLLFYEYFHGDNGAGLGASHQTGWTGLVARLIQLYGSWTPSASWKRGHRPGASRRSGPRGRVEPTPGPTQPSWYRRIQDRQGGRACRAFKDRDEADDSAGAGGDRRRAGAAPAAGAGPVPL